MENRENILDELTNFEKKHPKEIPQILEDYLTRIAKTGDTMFPWTKLKPLFMFKMQLVMSEFYESCPTDDIMQCPNVDRFKYDVMREKLLEAIDNFNSAPFTIQRLCELVTAPRKHYKHTDKFMRGLEKNVLVVSTVEPGCSHIFACDCARKRSEHQTAMINGVTEVPLNGVELHDEGRSTMHEDESKQNDNSNNPSSPNDTNKETTKERLDDNTNNDSLETTKDDEKRIETQEESETKNEDDVRCDEETKTEEELKNDNDDDEKADSEKEVEKENDNFNTEPSRDDEEEESTGRRDSVDENEPCASEKSPHYPDDEQGFDNNSESQVTSQPSSSDVGNHELPPVSVVTTVGDDDDDDDCGATGDNDDDDEMSVSMSLPMRDEAADIDDNTMDVPTSDVADADCGDLISSTSHVTSTAETLIATSDDDSRHSHERQEPMEED